MNGSDGEVKMVRRDVVVYGGTSAGVVAGVQAARMGRSVVVIEPTLFLGGLTTDGTRCAEQPSPFDYFTASQNGALSNTTPMAVPPVGCRRTAKHFARQNGLFHSFADTVK